MKTLEQLLRYLERPDVAELALVSDRLPCIRIGTSFDPVDEEAPSTDTILAMLVSVGGSRYVEMLGPTPKQWTSRLDGVGTVAISALQRGDHVQARFSIARRDEKTRGVLRKASTRPEAIVRAGSRSSRGSVRGASRDKMRSLSKRATLDEIVLDASSLPPPARTTTSTPPAALAAARRQMPTAPALRMSRQPEGLASADRGEHGRPLDARAEEHGGGGGGDGAARARGEGSPTRSQPNADAPREARSEASSEARVVSSPAARPSSTRPLPHSGPAAAAAVASRPLPSSPARVTSELDALLKAARQANASDLHIVAGRPAILRTAGELRLHGQPIGPEPAELMLLACVPPRLAPTLAEDGSCDFALEHEGTGRFRVNISRQLTGYKGSFRLIPREIPTLASLGMPAAIANATKHHQGLILFSGPTGHGKTSTLAAVIDILNRETTRHVITVEDPVEVVHPRKKALMSQREVGTHTQSFGTALKAALREDPDVIVVGELRDAETVRMAVAASETGHLVLGTMNTPSAAKTIDRLIDLFPPADQPQARLTIAAGLRLIVSQRLVPGADRQRFHVAAELLPGSVPLSALIREGRTFQIPSLQQRSKALGIVRLDESLADLVRDLHVTLEAAKAFAELPNELEALVTARRAPHREDAGAAARKGL
jgi:twitching motility protein PilT